jgi:hypothetical protein
MVARAFFEYAISLLLAPKQPFWQCLSLFFWQSKGTQNGNFTYLCLNLIRH